MRLWKTKKYFIILIFLTAGFTLAADLKKDENQYIEMYKGNDNAPVVFVEYASLTCPACAAFHTNVYPKLKKEYIETGKIKFIHREIYFDKAGLWAALTARCSNEVTRYFGMIDLLYSEQPTWSRLESSDKIVDALLKISAISGIERGKAISCLEDEEKALGLVNQYQIHLNKDAIESTPTFIINGKKYTNRSYDEIKEIIEKELKS